MEEVKPKVFEKNEVEYRDMSEWIALFVLFVIFQNFLLQLGICFKIFFVDFPLVYHLSIETFQNRQLHENKQKLYEKPILGKNVIVLC